MKRVIIIFVVLAIVGAGVYGWWYMFYRLEGLFEAEFERQASEAFGTQVTLEDVKLDLINGAVEFENLAIGNPEGFKREHAVVFGSIEAAVDFRTGQVRHVILENARINVEEKNGSINIQELKQALETRISDESGIEPGTGGDEQELVIQQFLMHSTTATFDSDTLQKQFEVEIDSIEMRDLRGTPEQVAELIAYSLLDEITEEAERALVQRQLEGIQDRALDKLREMLGDDEEGQGS
jgi:hypothetical protein